MTTALKFTSRWFWHHHEGDLSGSAWRAHLDALARFLERAQAPAVQLVSIDGEFSQTPIQREERARLMAAHQADKVLTGAALVSRSVDSRAEMLSSTWAMQAALTARDQTQARFFKELTGALDWLKNFIEPPHWRSLHDCVVAAGLVSPLRLQAGGDFLS